MVQGTSTRALLARRKLTFIIIAAQSACPTRTPSESRGPYRRWPLFPGSSSAWPASRGIGSGQYSCRSLSTTRSAPLGGAAIDTCPSTRTHKYYASKMKNNRMWRNMFDRPVEVLFFLSPVVLLSRSLIKLLHTCIMLSKNLLSVSTRTCVAVSANSTWNSFARA